jgi:hypothetical protein
MHSKNKKQIEKELNRKLTWNEYTMVNKGRIRDKQQKEKTFRKEAKKSEESIIETEIVEETEDKEEYPYGTPIELIEAYERYNFDELRRFLQQIAYGMVCKGVTQEEKDEFTKIMTYFANRDPMYKEMIVKLIPIIAKQEGILQSKIYPYLPQYGTELIRYVLYFAHELGDIRREKKGRSYELYTSTYVKHEVLENKV